MIRNGLSTGFVQRVERERSDELFLRPIVESGNRWFLEAAVYVTLFHSVEKGHVAQHEDTQFACGRILE